MKSGVRRRVMIIIDICMTVLLPMLMAYALVGEKLHEILGTIIFVLFIAHHVMNRGFYKSLTKGRLTPRRVFQIIVDFLLLVFMIMQPVSGILMSKHLYTFIKIKGVVATAREIHMCLAYWGFVLLSLHAGTHLTAPFSRVGKKSKTVWGFIQLGMTVASVYGIYAFIKRKFVDYMFIRQAFAFFDYSESRLHFFLDYIAIMILFAYLGYLIASGLSRLEKK